MAYPEAFHRLVIMGTIYAEQWNTTLSIVPVAGSGSLSLGEVSPTDLSTVAGIVATWFVGETPNGVGFLNDVKLTGIKLNRLDTAGHYTGTVTQEHLYPTPISGVAGAAHVPAQLTVVATLQTALERGRGSKGRMFLPPTSTLLDSQLGTDGRIPASNADAYADGVRKLVVDLNAAYVGIQSGDEKVGKVGVASNAGTGSFRPVTEIRVGRVVDTMRSRRAKLIEDPQVSATIP